MANPGSVAQREAGGYGTAPTPPHRGRFFLFCFVLFCLSFHPASPFPFVLPWKDAMRMGGIVSQEILDYPWDEEIWIFWTGLEVHSYFNSISDKTVWPEAKPTIYLCFSFSLLILIILWWLILQILFKISILLVLLSCLLFVLFCF